jgi:hypothetical protein
MEPTKDRPDDMLNTMGSALTLLPQWSRPRISRMKSKIAQLLVNQQRLRNGAGRGPAG